MSAPRRRQPEAPDAGELCECGRPLEGHPPLPRPKPWAEGRPCGRNTTPRYDQTAERPAPAARPTGGTE